MSVLAVNKYLFNIINCFFFVLVEKGLDTARVKLHFRDDNEKMLLDFRQNMNDINKLRKDYIEAGGSDPDFLLNLDNLQKFYTQTKPTISSLFPKDSVLEENNKSIS